MKKLAVSLFSLLFLASCGSTESAVIKEPTLTGDKTSEKLLAYQVVSSSELLGLMSNVKRANNLTAESINKIKNYLPSIEAGLLNQDEMIKSVSSESDKEGYTTKLTITYDDINLTESSITLYYNESKFVPDNEDENDNWYKGGHHKDDDDDKDDDDEHEGRGPKHATQPLPPAEEDTAAGEATEVVAPDTTAAVTEPEEYKSFLEGIVVIDGVEYEMKGKKEVEADESEISFKYFLNENSFVCVEQSIENEDSETEREFEYKVVNNGQMIYNYSLELENDEVELKTKSLKDGKMVLEFEFMEFEGRKIIKAEYKNETTGEKGELFFEKVTSEAGVSYELLDK